MDHAGLVEQVMQTAGLSTRHEAERALRATVSALGTCLCGQTRELWAQQLSVELYDDLMAAPSISRQSARQVYDRVPASEGVPQPYATEHAQSVIRVLGHALDDTTRALLARELPDDLAAMLKEPVATGHPKTRARARVDRPAGSTLATGSPAARHPLSESEPGTAQSGSVADWDDARMEHTLGSGHDAPGDTLATSKPGSKRGLSG
jgi:uncharacterized protein (DUF2267 family)